MKERSKSILRSNMTCDQMSKRYIDDRSPIAKRICHGDPKRSICMRGHPMNLCARCTFFYPSILSGILAGLLLIIMLDPSSWSMLILILALILPMVIDGMTQYHGLRVSNNLLRSITGLMAGSGSGIALVYLIIRLIFSFG